MAAEGLPIEVACRVLGVSASGYYELAGSPAFRTAAARDERDPASAECALLAERAQIVVAESQVLLQHLVAVLAEVRRPSDLHLAVRHARGAPQQRRLAALGMLHLFDEVARQRVGIAVEILRVADRRAGVETERIENLDRAVEQKYRDEL